MEYLRASSLSTYLECSAKFMFQNIERIWAPNKVALAFGSAVHKTLQENFSQKVSTRTDLPVTDIKDLFSMTVDQEFETVDKKDFDNEKPGEIKDSGIELVEKYHREHSYRIFPIAVEQRISIKLKGFDHGLTGAIDLIDEDGIIVDHKTSAKDFTEVPESYRLQVGGAYPLLWRAFKNEPVKAARTDFMIRKSNKSTGTQIRPISVPIDEQYFIRVFQKVSEGVKQGIFIPNRSHMYCCKRFCKFADVCQKKFGGKVRE